MKEKKKFFSCSDVLIHFIYKKKRKAVILHFLIPPFYKTSHYFLVLYLYRLCFDMFHGIEVELIDDKFLYGTVD